jgi:diacylglycerol kinase (ATP)
MKNRPFHKRLACAAAGILEGWRREKSFRSHILFAVAAMGALIALRPAPAWWAIVFLTIGLVLALELVNGAMEALIDHLHPEIHPQIRVVKDMAAGGVLIIAITALAVAGLLALDSI